MKVLDLQCAGDHRFEGWFASEDDYQAQDERGLLACPMCGDTRVARLPSAPRLNVSKHRAVADVPARVAAQPPADADARRMATVHAHMRQAVQRLMANTEDVGERFPEEARRIHYGEVAERGIRGRATAEEAEALAEEGIDVVAVPLPPALEGPLQ